MLNKINGEANIRSLISMINEDSLMETKKYLANVLPLVMAAELPDDGRTITCLRCQACMKISASGKMMFAMKEPSWSNCAACEVK